MAAHKKGSKYPKGFVAIPINASITLSTLANNTVLTGGILGTLTEDLFVMSADLQWNIRSLTVGETPVTVGLAHGDYSVGEILEALDVSMLGPGTKIEQERARRLIRRVGVFGESSADQALADGKSIKTKCKFVIQNGKDLNAYVVNRSGEANLTTGAIVQIFGTVYGRWIL